MSRNRIVNHLSIWGFAAAALALAAPDAQAQSAVSNIQVSAVVLRTCSIQTVDMNFGNYDPVTTHATTPLDITHRIGHDHLYERHQHPD